MRTGEGKTLVATLPGGPSTRSRAAACTWSRSTTIWPGATPNGWGAIYSFLGLTVGVIVHGVTDQDRKARTSATSPTARTTSSASTTCATT